MTVTDPARLLTDRSLMVDTTTGATMAPVKVTATMAAPVAGAPANPAHLDGPVSWAMWQEFIAAGGDAPPMTPDMCLDFRLPFAVWTRPAPAAGIHPLALNEAGDVWGWACSRAQPTSARPAVAPVRRQPDTVAMAHWTDANRHHLGLGPRRAVNAMHQAQVQSHLTWWALTPDPGELLRLLTTWLANIGRVARAGWGRVHAWTVEEDRSAHDRWADRAFPADDGPVGTIRAPYHHPTREMPSTIGSPRYQAGYR